MAKSMWQPQIPCSQSIYEESSTQQAPLGTRKEVGDRVLFYGKVSTSANVSAGNVVCASPLAASHQADILTPVATSAGVNKFSCAMGGLAITANEYYEGYVIVSTGTGNGNTYRIRTHNSIAASGTLEVTLYDTLNAPMTATNELNFVPNMYNNVKVGSSALDLPVGVAVCAVTTGNYAWFQAFGPCAALNQAATPAGAAVKVGTTGGVLAARADTEGGGAAAFEVGKNYNLAGTAGENTPVFLTIRQ